MQLIQLIFTCLLLTQPLCPIFISYALSKMLYVPEQFVLFSLIGMYMLLS